MDKKELAQLLNGRQYRNEITCSTKNISNYAWCCECNKKLFKLK